ncbi:MAG: hypothetical protein WD875_15255 [Pirellulales bacterium]
MEIESSVNNRLVAYGAKERLAVINLSYTTGIINLTHIYGRNNMTQFSKIIFAGVGLSLYVFVASQPAAARPVAQPEIGFFDRLVQVDLLNTPLTSGCAAVCRFSVGVSEKIAVVDLLSPNGETKARFITQVMTGESSQRRAEDIGGQELSYAEVKAIASGNPAVLTLAEADAELQRLAVLKKNHLDEQYVARRKLRDLPGVIAAKKDRVAKLDADNATQINLFGDRITIGERNCAMSEVQGAIAALLETLPVRVSEPRRVPLGTYHGLRFGLILHPSFPPDVYLEGQAVRRDTLSREHQGPRAIWNAVERLGGGYGRECAELRQDLGIAEAQLRDYQQRLGQPFAQEAYSSQLATLRDQLKAALSNHASEQSTKSGQSATELAERIKSLRAAHTVEAAPERAPHKETSAAESVTSRIRRGRLGSASEPMLGNDAVPPSFAIAACEATPDASPGARPTSLPPTSVNQRTSPNRRVTAAHEKVLAR